MTRTVPRTSTQWVLAWTAMAMTSLVAMAPARADPCDDALRKLEASSAHALECPELRNLDRSLRTCSASASTRRAEQIAVAQLTLSVALPRCSCDGAPRVATLEKKLSGIHSAFDLAAFEVSLAPAHACFSRYARADRQRIDKLDNDLKALKSARRYCGEPGLDFDRISQTPAGSCGEARLQRAALADWLTCSGTSPASEPRFDALKKRESKACSSAPPALTCDATLEIAERLKRSPDPSDARQLWNLVATRLIAAAGVRPTSEEQACASRMIAAVVPDSAIAARSDRATVESLVQDPQLRGRFVEKLSKALKNAGTAAALAKLLDAGVDIEEVVKQAAKLSEEEQRRFFSVAGSLGRTLQMVRAYSAFEQTARSFDVVIAPKLNDCKYADFINVLLAGLSKAVPARTEQVERARLGTTVDELVAARMRSCGKAEATDGPGCGAVIVVPIEDRAGDRGAGNVQLHFVTPDGNGGALHRQAPSIPIREFHAGCGVDSEESAAALRLMFELQFAFATNPREAPVVLDAMRTDVCGLRPLPPSHLPIAAYDRSGLSIRGPELDAELAGPADSARQVLRAWKDSVGEIDARRATASLRFSSASYADKQGNRGRKLVADLMLHDQKAASFAAVVLEDDQSCLAPFAARFVEAGRMIGNQAGSFLAYKRTDHPGQLRRWILPVGFALGEAALVTGGLYLINDGVRQENRAVMEGLDSAVPNNRLMWGRGLLLTAAVGALVGGVYAAIR